MDLAEREAISGRLSEALRVLISVRALDPSNRVLQARYAELSALFRGQIKSAASATKSWQAKFISNTRLEKRTLISEETRRALTTRSRDNSGSK